MGWPHPKMRRKAERLDGSGCELRPCAPSAVRLLFECQYGSSLMRATQEASIWLEHDESPTPQHIELELSSKRPPAHSDAAEAVTASLWAGPPAGSQCMSDH